MDRDNTMSTNKQTNTASLNQGQLAPLQAYQVKSLSCKSFWVALSPDFHKLSICHKSAVKLKYSTKSALVKSMFSWFWLPVW